MQKYKKPYKRKTKIKDFLLRLLIVIVAAGVLVIGIYNLGSGGNGVSSTISSSSFPESSEISTSVTGSDISSQPAISEMPTEAPTATAVPTATVAPTITAPVSSISSISSLSSVSLSSAASSHPVTSGPVSTVRTGWAYTPSGKEGVAATTSSSRVTLCNKYGGIWQGDAKSKVVYITMDVGYEYNNNTTKILDIAKAKNVKINFFITGALFKTEALRNLVARMDKEGHLVGNHTWNHPSMPILYNSSGASAIKAELDKVDAAFKAVTGHAIPRFMRPPMGEYSEATVKLTYELGYKTVFWSFAYRDWETDKQPDPDTALATIMTNLHNGTVFLIHTVSNTNVQILPQLIDNIRAKGYEMALLTDYK
ncbi:MAG: polysaccharide deacetylase family protein [Saccharofermentanales bacterium]